MRAPIVIVDDQDKPIGQAPKEEVYARGLRHRVVHAMIENDKGQVLLQHRSPTKDVYPNTWECSAAGTVDAGEGYDIAMVRELEEEIDVKGTKPEFIGSYESDEPWHELRFLRFNRVYKLKSNATPTKLEEGKVDDVRWFTVDEVKALIREHPDQVSDGLRQVMERYY